jgi:hypothetical protein
VRYTVAAQPLDGSRDAGLHALRGTRVLLSGVGEDVVELLERFLPYTGPSQAMSGEHGRDLGVAGELTSACLGKGLFRSARSSSLSL